MDFSPFGRHKNPMRFAHFLFTPSNTLHLPIVASVPWEADLWYWMFCFVVSGCLPNRVPIMRSEGGRQVRSQYLLLWLPPFWVTVGWLHPFPKGCSSCLLGLLQQSLFLGFGNCPSTYLLGIGVVSLQLLAQGCSDPLQIVPSLNPLQTLFLSVPFFLLIPIGNKVYFYRQHSWPTRHREVK